jgi:hypothetical protein
MLGLGATNPDRNAARNHRIVPRDDDSMVAVERLAEALTRAFPVEGASNLGAGHGVPA